MYIMKLQDIIKVTGLSRSTIYKLMSEGDFPKQVSLGYRSVGWVSTEIDDWIIARIEARDNAVA